MAQQEEAGVMIHTTDNSVNISGTGENKDKETPKEDIVTREIKVLEENVKVFTCGDMIMDLQLVSGAMIQITKSRDEGLEAGYRPVRLIGSLGSVDRAEKLIKAVVILDDAGRFALLHKDDNDSDGYRADDGDDQKQEPNQAEYSSEYSSEYTPPPRSFRKRSRLSLRTRPLSHKRPCVPLPSKQPTVCNQITPQGPLNNDLPQPPAYNTGSQAYAMPQPPANSQLSSQTFGIPQPPPASSGYATNQACSMPQPPAYNQSGGYAGSQAYVMPQPPANSQASGYAHHPPALSGYATNQAYVMPQPPAYIQAYVMPQPPANNQSSGYAHHPPALSGYATNQAYVMPQPPAYNQAYVMPQPPANNQSGGYAASQAFGMPQPPANNQSSEYASYDVSQLPAYNQSSGYEYYMPQPMPYYPYDAYYMPQPPIYNQSSGKATGAA